MYNLKTTLSVLISGSYRAMFVRTLCFMRVFVTEEESVCVGRREVSNFTKCVLYH